MSDDSLNLSTDYETETEEEVTTTNKEKQETENVEEKDNISVEEPKDLPPIAAKEGPDAKTKTPPKSEAPKKKEGTVLGKNKEKSKDRADTSSGESSKASESDASISYINHKGRAKSRKQLERERAFKKTPFAEVDPVLQDHKSERRVLAQRLEDDPEFRKQYIAEQEARRLAADESSVIDSADVEDAVRTIHKLQGVTDDVSEDASASFESNSFVDGISNDGSVNYSYDSSSRDERKNKKKGKNNKGKNKKGKNEGGIRAGVYINKLTIKKLVLKL